MYVTPAITFLHYETNYCGCEFSCACPTSLLAVETHTTIESAADYIARVIIAGNFENVRDVLFNGLEVSFYSPIRTVGRKKFYNPWHLSSKLRFGYDVKLDKEYEALLRQNLNSLMDALKPLMEQYCERENYSLLSEAEKLRLDEIKTLKALMEKYPEEV